jgi:threonine dehydratase
VGVGDEVTGRAAGQGEGAVIPTRSDIEAALVRIHTGIRRTPVVEIHGDELGVPARVLLKLELLQHTGSFKARGALNSVLLADPLPVGVAAVSGGNHAAAVAWAAGHAGIAADVFVPSMATPEKIERIRHFGGIAHVVDGVVDDAFTVGIAWAEEHGVPPIHPYQQAGTICGQGTVGLEIADQVPGADMVLVACGGGGLYAGLTIALDGRMRVQPVEPAGCPNLHAALAAGHPVRVDVGGVAADSLGPAEVGSTAFELASAHGVDVPLVSDEDIVAARRWLWQRCRILAEPGGSVALASLLTGAVKVHPGDTVVVVVSGGNNPTIP